MSSFFFSRAGFLLFVARFVTATIHSPARDVSWDISSPHQIQWDTARMKGPLKMHLCPGGATDLTTVISEMGSNIPNTGSWMWHPQSTITQQISFTIIIVDQLEYMTPSESFHMGGWSQQQYSPKEHKTSMENIAPPMHTTALEYVPPMHTTTLEYVAPPMHTTIIETLSINTSIMIYTTPPLDISTLIITSSIEPIIKTMESPPLIQTHLVAPVIITESQEPITKTMLQAAIMSTEVLAPTVKTIFVTETPAPIVMEISQPPLIITETQAPVLRTESQPPIITTISQAPYVVTEEQPPILITEHITQTHVIQHDTPRPSLISVIETTPALTSSSTEPFFSNTTTTSITEATSSIAGTIIVDSSATTTSTLGFNTSISVGGAAASTGLGGAPIPFTGGAGRTTLLSEGLWIVVSGILILIL